MSLAVVVLAAGQGKRMRSTLPKVLHPLAGKPLLGHILSTLEDLKPEQTIVIYGVGGEQLKKHFQGKAYITWVEQKEQRGTGHAVLQALETLKQNAKIDNVLIVCGDVPLIQAKTLTKLIDKVSMKDTPGVGVLTCITPNPFGLGRILRNSDGDITACVEEKDATDVQKNIQEINTGIFVVAKSLLEKWLPLIKSNNAQNECYLTDIIPMAVNENLKIENVLSPTEWEIRGVNDRVQLAFLERQYQLNNATRCMEAGVSISDPNRFDIRGDVSIGKDVFIDINVILEGKVSIGDHVTLGPNVIIKNSRIGNQVEILANSMVDASQVGDRCTIGPFARIRPETTLNDDVKIGNFVEIKKSTLGKDTKVNHLSYIGDASLGDRVNVGAGTITCNYDGKHKHQTIIGDDCFIGSDTQLIAPVSVGNSVTIGAGTTVTKDIPANHLVHNKVVHRDVANWKRDQEK
jgi:bifunctional UDP-N-acetylglucosamine pyrophosphorylase/glucosamine-1-phosphate N-acetyltransferase